MLGDVDEVRLAERLIAHDTSDPAGLAVAMDFAAGWLEGRGVDLRRHDLGDREVLVATAGTGPVRVILNGHMDVVPGNPGQFSPRIDGDRLIGRGAYDMKAALGAMMLATSDLAAAPPDGVQVELVIVPDEETRDLILDGASERQLRENAVSKGMTTLQQDGWSKIQQGETSVEEFLRVLRF